MYESRQATDRRTRLGVEKGAQAGSVDVIFRAYMKLYAQGSGEEQTIGCQKSFACQCPGSSLLSPGCKVNGVCTNCTKATFVLPLRRPARK